MHIKVGNNLPFCLKTRSNIKQSYELPLILGHPLGGSNILVAQRTSRICFLPYVKKYGQTPHIWELLAVRQNVISSSLLVCTYIWVVQSAAHHVGRSRGCLRFIFNNAKSSIYFWICWQVSGHMNLGLPQQRAISL